MSSTSTTNDTTGTTIGTGFLLVAVSVVLLVMGTYTMFLSSYLPPTGIPVRLPALLAHPILILMFRQPLDSLSQDAHYKYFAVLFIPAGVYFVIANWVGWQYFRNS